LLDALLTSYDAHGLLGVYPMHLLSESAWRALLSGRRFARLLDVGAGAGYVTEGARTSFEHVTCTETSRFLRRRLRKRGFAVSACDVTVTDLGQRFDVVSCFNVLDRTARPLSLLRGARDHLVPQGLCLLALPLPVDAHVHVPGGTVSPSERLPAAARTWEGALVELSERLIEPLGFTIERVARAPYLSRGDEGQTLYVLDAAVWVCRRRDEAP
jgi:SAM-dependent methyltransferase